MTKRGHELVIALMIGDVLTLITLFHPRLQLPQGHSLEPLGILCQARPFNPDEIAVSRRRSNVRRPRSEV